VGFWIRVLAGGTCLLVLLALFSFVGEHATAQPQAWTEQSPTLSPAARSFHDMAYDVQSDRIILFGGNAPGLRPLNDTWAYDYDASTWTDMSPGVAPSPRGGFGMAYDSQSDRVVLFGGLDEDSGATNNETWAYDLESNRWTNMTAPGSPSRRFETHMVYDAESDRTILYGGLGPGFALLRETWTYDLNTNTWTNENPTPTPSAAANDYMAYDARSDRMIHFGGVREPLPQESGETWAYDLNANRWTNLAPNPSPSPRSVPAMAYDAESDRIVMVLRSVANPETWVFNFDANSWVDASGGDAPTRRDRGYRMAYDADSDRMILFGGQLGGDEGFGTPPPYFDDTWALNLNAVPVPPPPPPLPLWIAASIAGAAAAAIGTVIFLRRRKRGTGGKQGTS